MPHDSECATAPGCARYESVYPPGSFQLSDTIETMQSDHTRQTNLVARPKDSPHRIKTLPASTTQLLKPQECNLIRETGFVQHSFLIRC
jgi:hypothetical protein